MSTERLRIGMIGCGDAGLRAARGIQDAEHAELAGVMDVNEQLVRDLGDQCAVPWTCDLAELLALPHLDAVYIAVPNYLLTSIALTAVAAGKHILCEKPMATSVADADRMIAACADAGLTLGVAFEAQVTPEIQRLQELVRGGAIGEVMGTRITLMMDKPDTYWTHGYTGRVVTDWRLSKAKAGGGMLVTTCIHDINAVLYISGLEASRVYAEYGAYMNPVDVEDLIVVSVRYSNGAIGHIEGGSHIPGNEDPMDWTVHIYGKEGQVALGETLRIFTTRADAGVPAHSWYEVGPKHEAHAGRTRVMEGFAAAVLAGRRPPVTGEDGRAALAIAMAAYQAGQEKRPVELLGH